MRGADALSKLYQEEFTDSSPHARGRQGLPFHRAERLRLIPSYEGQTEIASMLSWFIMIHPLIRGANNSFFASRPYVPDSSPHTRGKPSTSLSASSSLRFIPSYEGQTLSVYAAFSRLKHLVVQFAQMPFSTRHTSFSLHIIYRKNIFFAIFPNIFLYFFNPHSVFIVYNNFFTFTHTVIFCVYLYIFKDSCFRPAEILKIFNF